MKMKVLLVSCLMFAVAQATFGGKSSGGHGSGGGHGGGGGGGSNILGSLIGGLFRSILGGQNNDAGDSNGIIVDGEGGGIPGAVPVDFGPLPDLSSISGGGDGGYDYQVPETIQQNVDTQGGYVYEQHQPQPQVHAQPDIQYIIQQHQPQPQVQAQPDIQYIIQQHQPQPQVQAQPQIHKIIYEQAPVASPQSSYLPVEVGGGGHQVQQVQQVQLVEEKKKGIDLSGIFDLKTQAVDHFQQKANQPFEQKKDTLQQLSSFLTKLLSAGGH